MRLKPPHRTQVTELLWPDKVSSILRRGTSHTLTVPSFEAEASRGLPGDWLWYGSQDMLVIHFVWPFSGPPRASPVLGSHSLTVLSMLPDASIRPSGDHATARTQLVCPFNVWRGVPVSQSHILTVLSPLPVAILDDTSGENAVANIASPCPDIEAEHLVTARTRKTAWGMNWRMMLSSVVLKPGRRTEW